MIKYRQNPKQKCQTHMLFKPNSPRNRERVELPKKQDRIYPCVQVR